MARTADSGCSKRYEKERDALRRLESAVDKDLSLTIERRHGIVQKLRDLIDDLSLLIVESDNEGLEIADAPGLNRRGRNMVGKQAHRPSTITSKKTEKQAQR